MAQPVAWHVSSSGWKMTRRKNDEPRYFRFQKAGAELLADHQPEERRVYDTTQYRAQRGLGVKCLVQPAALGRI